MSAVITKKKRTKRQQNNHTKRHCPALSLVLVQQILYAALYICILRHHSVSAFVPCILLILSIGRHFFIRFICLFLFRRASFGLQGVFVSLVARFAYPKGLQHVTGREKVGLGLVWGHLLSIFATGRVDNEGYWSDLDDTINRHK